MYKRQGWHSLKAHASQALEEGALDVEIQEHLDARNLNFTLIPSPSNAGLSCEDHYGSELGGCAQLMYLDRTRSLRVRPPPSQPRLSSPFLAGTTQC